MNIVTYPAPMLLQKAKTVEHITAEKITLLHVMERVMEKHGGIGLAAPQVGVGERIIIVKHIRGKKQKNLAFFNPQIMKKSGKQIKDREGCLSLPNLFLDIKRSAEVEVKAQTPEGKDVRILAKGLTARIFQHEIDHLNGILIFERINPLARWRLRRILKEIARHGTY